MENLPKGSFSESSLKRDSYIFYSSEEILELEKKEYEILRSHLTDKQNYNVVKESVEKYGGRSEEVEFLIENLIECNDNELKTVHNLIHVSYKPEKKFVQTLLANIELFDSFLKSPDKEFYSFPYSYKPSEIGSSHVKRESFNPDFFLKIKGENKVLVVEIKEDGTLS